MQRRVQQLGVRRGWGARGGGCVGVDRVGWGLGKTRNGSRRGLSFFTMVQRQRATAVDGIGCTHQHSSAHIRAPAHASPHPSLYSAPRPSPFSHQNVPTNSSILDVAFSLLPSQRHPGLQTAAHIHPSGSGPWFLGIGKLNQPHALLPALLHLVRFNFGSYLQPPTLALTCTSCRSAASCPLMPARSAAKQGPCRSMSAASAQKASASSRITTSSGEARSDMPCEGHTHTRERG